MNAPNFCLICDKRLNYAFQQNAIPAVKELRFQNDSKDRKELTLRIVSEPAFAASFEVRYESLEASSELHLTEVDLKLSHDYLEGLNEKVTGHLKVEMCEAGEVICTHIEPVALLARNEWSGLVSLPEILAAFILPNDPAVMEILGRASEILKVHTGRSALNGYQDKNRKMAWEQIAAIYKAIGDMGIRYITPPASFETSGQKIRFPSDITHQRFGTCLDIALLFAACCEQIGLNPFVLIHEGHAYAGCWLEERTLPDASSDDLQHIRKLADDHLITVFETTTVTGDTPGTLRDAELIAQKHLITTAPFRLALDVRRARISRVHPLPIPGQLPYVAAGNNQGRPSSEGLGERDFGKAVSTSDSRSRQSTRIDQWKSRLLDLSLRNRLLNFKETKGTIRILTPSPEHVEDELSTDNELTLQPRPKVMGEKDPRDSATYARQQLTDPVAAHLRDELKHGRLHTDAPEAEHASRLTEIFRAARIALHENGTNTLFAAVGFLEWKETEKGDRVLRSPILLVPVELRRKSVIEGFTLRRVDEDTRLNVTLLEMLRQVFHKEIPGLDPLPEDDKGVDVERVFQLVRDAVRDLPGWEVKTDVWLGQFSFTKFLLWKDLADRLDDLTRNRVVRHLVHESGGQFPNPSGDIRAEHLDDKFHPKDVFCPRSADSSQLSAVMAAAAGHDFILEGPPGTGKSQTITNVIAHCLAEGKRVLFVAEKRAALDVVHRRLREEGLEPFCLELHSNKIGKTEVLAQFERSLKFVGDPTPPDWEHRASELERLRGTLNSYTRALHLPRSCGLSAHDCLDYLLPRQSLATIRFESSFNVLGISPETLDKAREMFQTLEERTLRVAPVRDNPLSYLTCTEWSPLWSEKCLDQLHQLSDLTKAAMASSQELRSWLQITGTTSREELAHLGALAEILLAPHPVGPGFATTPWSTLAADLDSWTALVRERQELRAKLVSYDTEKLLSLDLVTLQSAWQATQTSWFLPRWLGTRKLGKQLAATRPEASTPDESTISGILAAGLRLKQINASLSAASPTAQASLADLWAKGEPSLETLSQVRSWGEPLHRRISACAGGNLNRLSHLRNLLADLFNQGPDAYALGTPLGNKLSSLGDNLKRFHKALDGLVIELSLQRQHLDAAPNHLESVLSEVEKLITGWPKIREWCSWQNAKQEALAIGLKPVIAKLEEDALLDAKGLFERSFRRALFFAIIESEPTLRSFIGGDHEQAIVRFRTMDERLASLTRSLIQARLSARIPRDQIPHDIPKAELGLLRKEIGKKTRHIPVRRLLGGIPKLLPRLKPCVLMSPLSVAQYLDASHEPYDIVIFDEASQIPVWDAIGAIARGKQLIVVGDPKQLPPTNFFSSRSDEEEENVPEENKDLESILDELLTIGLRHKRLQWHYRSRHEGLITFSNRRYYENDLLTFPSPQTGPGGVSFRHLPDARYDKGKTRTNRGEALALVKELIARLKDSKGTKHSYGVVTFSQAQQQLIENLLDEERRKHPDLESHFGDEPPVEGEPVFVKNLENVQGDERDVIFFSICYGPDETGRVSMNFGPLNRDGGERRLNVAITRAKHEVLVFSGLRGDQIDLTRTRSKGVGDLKHFLEYAERGPKALSAAGSVVEGKSRSEFEHMVAERIRAAGYEIQHQVGCSDYRVDIGVVSPTSPDRFLLGIECDGPTYNRAATARDRDKLRQAILEGLGWKLYRIWSTDWWHDPEGQTQKLLQHLKSLK